jgi:hypothetical protein
MIDFLSIKRVVVFADKVDFRKGFNGLLAIACAHGYAPYEGDALVFVKRDGSQLRALAGDDKGLVLINRRFEGKAPKFVFDGSRRTLSRAELSLLFEGVEYTVNRRAESWRAS